jgi:hypothetical protein
MSQWLERLRAASTAPMCVPTCQHRTQCGEDGHSVCTACGEMLDESGLEPHTQEACPPPEYVPPPYPGHAVGAPFRPGHQVWLYRWDDQTPRFDAPVTIVQLRTLWPGEQDIGWCDATGEVTWHNARLAVAVETQELRRHPQTATQE